ncbi:hypothetical protein ACMSX5_003635 [Cronobacter turicensis]|uniref:DUF4760 domain-containing protein n=1 Tax=Cronobacter turicensis (strain DSM 18703 / CCUG 55852 / LMG 23827 / z3032) TaxID=693216 RepID=C9Y3U1_CROTZ|nr:hypothetical protein [Cronobacter turicensis]CBA30736.1 unknown protein [Cronobacter turicensis z3032]EGT5680458.1 hypothetical protein [Cronobacter turicensis]EGT5738655.1 hypothetical protein [Cronobacter turicensis]EKM0374719.1 hypothetical protein [Cronobacter turicensis]EKM5065021.1 hypothetical protein [Cronobacter turicensis]
MPEPATYSAIAATCAAIAAGINAYIGYKNRMDALDKPVLDRLIKKAEECNALIIKNHHSMIYEDDKMGDTSRIYTLLYLSMKDCESIGKGIPLINRIDYFKNKRDSKIEDLKDYFFDILHATIWVDLKDKNAAKKSRNDTLKSQANAVTKFYEKQIKRK